MCAEGNAALQLVQGRDGCFADVKIMLKHRYLVYEALDFWPTLPNSFFG